MEPFYYIVLTIAVVFLILILIFVGIMMQGQNKGTSFPPVSNVCPDNWVLDVSSCIVPGTSSASYSKSVDNTKVNVGTISTALTKYGTETSLNNDKLSNNIPYSFSSKKGIIINPTDNYWTKDGMTATCGQKQWATRMGIQWDGVSNYNGC